MYDINNERDAALWLCSDTNVFLDTKHRIYNHFQSALTVFERIHQFKSKMLYSEWVSDQKLFSESTINGLIDSLNTFDRDRVLEELWRVGAEFVHRDDAKYPERFKKIANPPIGFFKIGELPKNNKPAIAVVGSRACSEYGRYVCEKLAKELCGYGINLISGLALGIDSVGHEAALRAGKKTYAVLGNGIGSIYPANNSRLYGRIIENGGVISEYYIGTKSLPLNFPERNRLISGLSDGVLVIEAMKKSGTMITVRHCLDQGKDVFVVPGRITDNLSEGCNMLIKQGAVPVTCAEDIIYALKNKYSYLEPKGNKKQRNIGMEGLNENEVKIVGIIRSAPRCIDEIISMSGVDYFECVETLDRLITKSVIFENSAGLYAIS